MNWQVFLMDGQGVWVCEGEGVGMCVGREGVGGRGEKSFDMAN